MKREIELSIAGQRLKIRTDEDEEYMQQLATHVDEQMRELGRGQRGTTSLNVALLAALRIADELHKLRAAHGDSDVVLQRLAEQIETVLEQSAR